MFTDEQVNHIGCPPRTVCPCSWPLSAHCLPIRWAAGGYFILPVLCFS